VETPEQVAVGYELAGPGSRFVAFLLDALIILFALLAVYLTALFLFMGSLRAFTSVALELGMWLLAGVMVVNFLLIWGYFVAFEAFAGGRTPGKRWMGLRVIHSSGFPLSLPGAVIRNLLRILDLQPGITGILGGLFILFHPRAQRPGDLAAGTVVIREREVAEISSFTGPEESDDAPAAGAAAQGAESLPPRLSEPAWALLESWKADQAHLARSARRKVATRLHEALSARYPDLLPPVGRRRGVSPATVADGLERVLLALHADETKRRAGGPASGSAPASPQPRGAPGEGKAGTAAAAALLRRQRGRWRRWDTLLGRARTRGLAALDEGEVADFASLYRELTADLARARTYRASPGLLATLEASVGRGYNLLYSAPRAPSRSLVRAFTHGFPRLVRRRALPVWIATLLFVGPGVATWVAVVAQPSLAESVVSGVMLDRAREAESLRARGIGYGEAVISETERPAAAASILTNNVRVTFTAFLGGVLAGVGTLAVLVLNGVMLGGSGAAFQLEGQSLHLWAFVLPHGVLELTAIFLAGGAGLWMGSAFLIPGRQTRGEALATRALEAVQLLGGVVVLLVVAGIIEGFVSPSPGIPEWGKVLFGILTGAVLFPWLLLGGREEEEGGDSPSGVRSLRLHAPVSRR
jgi:uncharacterized membrane protein SpoIIM required for sporulation/uncharacterized RDD family membrane protein YckC